jgi:FkbM family methyltransferase
MKRLDRLKTQFAASLESARQNPMHGLPAWADEAYLARARQTPIVICGTGHWAEAFLDATRKFAEVVAVVDDSHAGRMVLGYPCMSTDGLIDLLAKHPEIVCLNTGQSHAGYGHFACLAEELGLKMLNFLQVVRAWRLEVDIRVADWLPAIVARAEEFVATEPMLYDEASAESLYAFLLYHLDTDREPLVTGNRPGDSTYFRTGLFPLSDGEVYVDCGSFDGDSVRNFVHATRTRFQHVHAFEPDPINFARMQKWLERQDRFAFSRRITLHQAAVGDTNGTLTFNDTGGEGACVPIFGAQDERLVGVKEGITVPAVRLDDALRDRISLLKLDVEGHELAILRGAAGHLRADHPRIAACAYHLPTDLMELPRFIAGLDTGYRLALRHHSNTRYDTVLYAF